MSEKRKDNKGRILKDGESQRSDGRYMYRYTDVTGNRQCAYAHDLKELREKEARISKDIADGIDYQKGGISIVELVERYIGQKQNVRYNTRVGYNFVLNLIRKQSFCVKPIRDVRISDAKSFFIKLHNDGYSHSTITAVRGVLKPAFDMAVEDDIVRKNPFMFCVSDVVPNDTVARKALTPEEVNKLLSYMSADKCRRRHLNEVIILLGTGLRISELYGLTLADVDFVNRRIHIERQLTRTRHCGYYIEKPKTKSGERYVPMDEVVYMAFKDAIKARGKPRIEHIIDGHAGFIFLDKDGKPKVAGHLEHSLKRIVDHYNESHDDKLVVTPHVLRHTFCTNYAIKGIDIKSLQYLMGHSDTYTTLNVYTHSSYETAKTAFQKLAPTGTET